MGNSGGQPNEGGIRIVGGADAGRSSVDPASLILSTNLFTLTAAMAKIDLI